MVTVRQKETQLVLSIDIHERGHDEPAWRGLFYANEVGRLLLATDKKIHGESLNVGPRAVQSWGRRGFFGMGKNEYAQNRAFIRFGGVITSRVIALLRSYGTRIGRIKEAHDFLTCETGRPFPFASRRFWVESEGFSREVYAELDRMVVTASRFGQLPFTALLSGRIHAIDDMTFDKSESGFAAKWEPVTGVVIDPFVQSGAACVKGTRTPTSVLYGGLEAGEDIAGLAYWYELDEAQVVAAIDWEKRLAEVS